MHLVGVTSCAGSSLGVLDHVTGCFAHWYGFFCCFLFGSEWLFQPNPINHNPFFPFKSGGQTLKFEVTWKFGMREIFFHKSIGPP